MKKLTYIFLLASCLLLASCESWLDEDPQYTLNTQIQFSTSEKARAALYGCYGYFALTSGGYGQHWQEIPVRDVYKRQLVEESRKPVLSLKIRMNLS